MKDRIATQLEKYDQLYLLRLILNYFATVVFQTSKHIQTFDKKKMHSNLISTSFYAFKSFPSLRYNGTRCEEMSFRR